MVERRVIRDSSTMMGARGVIGAARWGSLTEERVVVVVVVAVRRDRRPPLDPVEGGAGGTRKPSSPVCPFMEEEVEEEAVEREVRGVAVVSEIRGITWEGETFDGFDFP